MTALLRILALATACALLVCAHGCTGDDNQPRPVNSDLMAQLEQTLASELERLGKDADKHPAAAPTGSDNRVFFLSLFLMDPDGGGPAPPEGVEIFFCGQCVGDYDANGEVNIGDLTPCLLYTSPSPRD